MRNDPWLRAGIDLWSLGAEAWFVVALRMMKLSAGGAAAEAESRRMVGEKIAAGMALQTMAMTGGLGATPAGATTKTIALYRRKVRGNRRRLSKKT